MFPLRTVGNPRDAASRDAVFAGQCGHPTVRQAVGGDAGDDLCRLRLRKFRAPMRFADAAAPFGDLVSDVVAIRSDEQVGRIDTRRVIAPMEDAETCRYRTVRSLPRD